MSDAVVSPECSNNYCNSIESIGHSRALEDSEDDSLSNSNKKFDTCRSDSGISTIDSAYSKTSSSLSSLLLAEHHNNNISNNNYFFDEQSQNNNNGIDVVKLLKLKSTEDETQQISNSSSLESLTSLDNQQELLEQNANANNEDEDDLGSGSTSCSEDSFEMSSTCSNRETPETSPLRGGRNDVKTNWNQIRLHKGLADDDEDEDELLGDCLRRIHPELMMSTTSSGVHDVSMTTTCQSVSRASVRESISRELSNLDTGLPDLDFDKLEEQLKQAAREREDHERKLLGEEVRRRLALQVDSTTGPCPVVNTRPNRSNLAMRLQTAMNLQVCYMNELAESTAEDDDDDDDDDETTDTENDEDDDNVSAFSSFMSKSRSSPNLRKSSRPGSSKEAPELGRLRQKALDDRELDGYERRKLLVSETRRVLDSAKLEAIRAAEHFRRTKSKACVVPRQSRQHLSKMSWQQIQRIHDIMSAAIAQKNVELVNLLIDRDSLHMENDSLLVDIEDFTEHEAQASALDFRQLLRMQTGELPPAPRNTSSIGPTFSGSTTNEMKNRTLSAKVSAPTPLTTPTSPSRSFVASLSLLSTSLPALPKSLSKFSLFGTNSSSSSSSSSSTSTTNTCR